MKMTMVVAAGCRVKREKMRVRKDQEGRLLGSGRKDVVSYSIGKVNSSSNYIVYVRKVYTFGGRYRYTFTM